MNYLKSTNYWTSLASVVALWCVSPRLGGVTFVLISVISVSYSIGRGITEFGKGGTKAGLLSPEFQVMVLSLIAILMNAENNFQLSIACAVACKAGYNLGRGLAGHYRSKIQTVFNR